ncbi:MAG TPA: tRNA pseudouridine(38-40) synthase TruA [Nitrospiraceae bacterium]|nr:tRNA pseudouridine(38-40) synthase TruA [Nitrospiraceae bacterium]
MPTFKVTLEYDGTAYAGWQRQPDQPTIQEAVEAALRGITQADISAIAAGRTDAGVHALGQVVSFTSEKSLTPDEWLRALNATLPEDISVRAVERAVDDFHARYSAVKKLYAYRILHRPSRSALERTRAWHVYGRLNVDAMRQATGHLVGKYDFSSFQGHPTDVENPICDLQRLEIVRNQDVVGIEIEADRFLKQMVRAMVGTLVEVGQEKRKPEELKQILEAKDRRAAGYTAPAQGLYLVKVEY